MEKKIPTNTITRDIKDLAAPTGNIYETVVILAKRANQIALAEKKELAKKLEDFRGELRAQVLQRTPGLPAGGQPRAVAGEMVQHRKLEMRVGQQQALVLRMDVHQALRHLLQQTDLDRTVVDEAARTSRTGHHAADQQRAAVRFHVRLGQQGVQGFVLAGELRLDHAGISSLLDQRRVRLCP